jgi:hypothetical protein
LRKEDGETRSVARDAGRFDGASVLLDNPFYEAQAEANAFDGFVACRVCPIETLEDVG